LRRLLGICSQHHSSSIFGPLLPPSMTRSAGGKGCGPGSDTSRSQSRACRRRRSTVG
jgi:hypothetical protein